MLKWSDYYYVLFLEVRLFGERHCGSGMVFVEAKDEEEDGLDVFLVINGCCCTSFRFLWWTDFLLLLVFGCLAGLVSKCICTDDDNGVVEDDDELVDRSKGLVMKACL